MTGALAAAPAIALGCALVYRFGSAGGPRWARWMAVAGAGTAVGMGLGACLYFLCRLAAPGMPRLGLAIEVAALAWLGWECFRRRTESAEDGTAAGSLLVPGLMAAAGLAVALATAAMASAWDANPQGNWDAWSIWNLRARFLAGEAPERAWSAAVPAMHPEYPLLLPAFVARCWSYAGEVSNAAPIVASYLFFVAMVAMVAGGIARARGATFGLLAGLVLLGTPALLRETPSQYADIAVACYMAGAVATLVGGDALIAGLLAGLAAFTKDEGLLFAVVFLAAVALLRRAAIARAASGAAPGLAVATLFKLALAPSVAAYLQGGQRFEIGRIPVILAALARDFASIGSGLHHPALALAALAIGLGIRRGAGKEALFAWSIPAAMLVGYCAVFLVTPYDLQWQLDTSMYRLVAQVWPLVTIACVWSMDGLKGVAAPEAPAKARKKKARG